MSAAGRRAWGWHRLTDDWARRIVDGSAVAPGDLVLELGAGDGALTRPLLATGARVVAVELHRHRAAQVRRLQPADRLTVVEADARVVPLPRRPFRVVSNPPFAGSTAILRHLLQRGSRLVSADLVVERGFALGVRAGTTPGARAWHGRWNVTLHRIPADAFRPRPRVEVVVLRLRRRR